MFQKHCLCRVAQIDHFGIYLFNKSRRNLDFHCSTAALLDLYLACTNYPFSEGTAYLTLLVCWSSSSYCVSDSCRCSYVSLRGEFVYLSFLCYPLCSHFDKENFQSLFRCAFLGFSKMSQCLLTSVLIPSEFLVE